MNKEWTGVAKREWRTADTRRREDPNYDVGERAVARQLVRESTADRHAWVLKGTDQSKASDTSYAADSALKLTVASGVYNITGRVLATSTSATPDIKVQLSWPASSSLLGMYWSNAGTATVITEDTTSPAIATNFDIAANGITLIQFDVMLVVGASGTFAVEWAQNSSNSTATTVKAGSFLRYRKTV